ncbi:hypothetical protein LCGC14_1723540, partial [marine sediment metagenome]
IREPYGLIITENPYIRGELPPDARN